jgi:hypothetical protein
VTGETLLEVKISPFLFIKKRGIKTLAVDNVSLCIYKGKHWDLWENPAVERPLLAGSLPSEKS